METKPKKKLKTLKDSITLGLSYLIGYTPLVCLHFIFVVIFN